MARLHCCLIVRLRSPCRYTLATTFRSANNSPILMWLCLTALEMSVIWAFCVTFCVIYCTSRASSPIWYCMMPVLTCTIKTCSEISSSLMKAFGSFFRLRWAHRHMLTFNFDSVMFHACQATRWDGDANIFGPRRSSRRSNRRWVRRWHFGACCPTFHTTSSCLRSVGSFWPVSVVLCHLILSQHSNNNFFVGFFIAICHFWVSAANDVIKSTKS